LFDPFFGRFRSSRRPPASLTADEICDHTHYAPILCLEPSLVNDGHFSVLHLENYASGHVRRKDTME
jgi:hypothetical protein